jgi:hypothetical protein
VRVPHEAPRDGDKIGAYSHAATPSCSVMATG